MTRKYIYERENWADFTWDSEAILAQIAAVRNLQGRLFGRMESLGFALRGEAQLAVLTSDMVKSFEIEGEHLNEDQVRSSIARRLGISIPKAALSDRNVDGIVEMMLDATQRFDAPLTKERLFGWHAALFPTGHSGAHRIETAMYRTQPVYVVSGAMGREKIHYTALNAKRVQTEMRRFLKWLNAGNGPDPILKAAIAHIWFVLIHPFEDGNGRIARAITDMMLAKSDGSPNRYYSMSDSIQVAKKQYYTAIQSVSTGAGDITDWLIWFYDCLESAVLRSDALLDDVLRKARFWTRAEKISLNDRQKKMLERLMNDFKGNLTTAKWAKITKVSDDTALRDINDLIAKRLLKKTSAGGRSASYELR